MKKIESISVLFQAREEKTKQAEAKRAELKQKLDRALDEADNLDKAAEAKRKEAEGIYEEIGALDYGDWISDVLRPLADELARRTGKHPKLLGPAGLRSKVIIALVDDPDRQPYEQVSLELTVEPVFEDKSLFINYETGEASDCCEHGTAGYVNGLNNITARLPDSIENIMGLLRPHPAFNPKKKEGTV